jgi:hypothetical protein
LTAGSAIGEDSGYGSNTDDESEHLNELVEKFRQMEPQISNLGDVALEMIQTEQRMFQQRVSFIESPIIEAIALYFILCSVRRPSVTQGKP